MDRSKKNIWVMLSLGAVVLGGVLAVLIRWGYLSDYWTLLAFASVLIIGMGLSKPRQPYAVLYQPRGFATRLLKWASAPQVEATILWWFGLSVLIQPASEASWVGVHLTTGWLFLILGWLLVAHMPNPMEFTLIVSARLCFTILVVLGTLQREPSLLVIGAYLGSMLHGVLAMLLHWTLREVADLVVRLRQEVQGLSP